MKILGEEMNGGEGGEDIQKEKEWPEKMGYRRSRMEYIRK